MTSAEHNQTIRVWAPEAGRVDVVLSPSGRCIPMTREDGDSPGDGAAGWWRGPDLPVGSRYAFSPDGRGPFPDPRSRFQPEGVDGPSQVWIPPSAQNRVASPATSVLGGVIEEIHVGTFTTGGTLVSAIDRLPDLVDLGVTTVELMPIAQFSGEFGWGYDGVDLFAVHRAYGGPDALVAFTNAAHRLGLAVCIDVVLNHLGAWGNYLSQLGPYYSERHQTPWGPGFDLDGPHCAEPRAFLIDVCRNWLVDFGADALRLDAVHAIHDDSPVHLLQELSTHVHEWEASTGRSFTVIAESDLNRISMVTPIEEGGMGMDAQWADDVHHAILVALTGESQGYYADFADPGALVHVLEDVFHHDGRWSSFRRRNWGEPVPHAVDRRRFVVCSQDHDQIGNRAEGDRPSQRLNDAQLAAAAALILLSPFTPMLFQGEEWGTRTPFQFFSAQEGEDRARIVREGRQREFGEHGWQDTVPDPTSRSTLEASVLDWSQRTGPRESTILTWYRNLTALRREHPDVRSGRRQRATRTGYIIRTVNGSLVLEADLRGEALPKVPSGRILAEFPAAGNRGVAVRVLDKGTSGGTIADE